MRDIVKAETIEQKIFLIRGQKVMIDRDLAELYGVETKYLNRQVKRNRERFPEEFMFQLAPEEKKELVTNWHQFKSLKHSYVLPYVFTENGVAMLASVLKSKRAIKISIHIIKTFVRLRKWISTHRELALKLAELEKRVGKHDEDIRALVETIRRLTMEPERPQRRRIGFHAETRDILTSPTAMARIRAGEEDVRSLEQARSSLTSPCFGLS